MEKLQFLKRLLGDSKKGSNNNYEFFCPFCRHYKPKLSINLIGQWHCWVCKIRGGNVQSLAKRLCLSDDIVDESKVYFPPTSTQLNVDIKKSEILHLPEAFLPLWKNTNSYNASRAMAYLKHRGITECDIIKHSIGYCQYGRYAGMLIFPSYDEYGNLLYFYARSYERNNRISHLTPGWSKNFIGDLNQINWSEPIILVESKINAITIRRNAIPTYGKRIPQKLCEKILDEMVQDIYVCFDGDAQSEIYDYVDYFLKHGINVYNVKVPLTEDVNSLGFSKIWDLIDKKIKMTDTGSFEYNIKKLL